MIGNKKGISMIVSTMIIILLVIVAVGILWFAARGIFEGGGEQLALSSKCLAVDMKASGSCNATSCNATLERRAGGEAFGGVKLVVSSAAANVIVEQAGNVAPLEKTTITNAITDLADPTKMEIVVYFEDDAGAEQLCAGPVATVTL